MYPFLSRFLWMVVILLLPLATGEVCEAITTPGVTVGVDHPVAAEQVYKFRSTIRQQYDFSCGSAAIATLLTYHYEDSVTEEEVFSAMYGAGDQERIRARGFSLLDMKNYLERRGYRAAGYRAPLDQLATMGLPMIVLIWHEECWHFVVVKGISESQVLLGDPVFGVRVMSRSRFEQLWNGVSFIIRSKTDVARRHFNDESEWQNKVNVPEERVEAGS